MLNPKNQPNVFVINKQFVLYNYKPNIICVMCLESWEYMLCKWISRFHALALHKSHNMLSMINETLIL